jgi:hypothetical protein
MRALKCRLRFTLARHHGWSRAIPESTLLNWALEDSEKGEGKRALEALSSEPYIAVHPSRGVQIKNDPDSQAALAARLIRVCHYSRLQVEATLSRFRAAGGADAYDLEDVSEALPDW